MKASLMNMSYIAKKKRSKNYITPAVFLAAGMGVTAINVSAVSADTETGWDINGNGSGNISDANSAGSSANSSASSNASSKASSNTSAGGSVSGSTSIGWIDVYVDHTKLDDAIKDAISQGLDVVHDPSIVLEGDATETVKNTATATASYKSQAAYIRSMAAKYTNDMANYKATVDKNRADAANANANMDALRSNLAAQQQVTVLKSKQFSESEFAADTAAIQKSIADGRALIDAKNAVNGAQQTQNGMVLFTTAAAQGNVKLQRKTVSIANQADADKYIADLNKQYQELQSYLNSLPGITGTIPDDQKPTYTLYDFVVDADVMEKGTAPVTTYNYTPIPVTQPVRPSVNYHYYDVRSKPSGESNWGNKDGETIIIDSNANANGNKVAQAMKNQTVGINTDNQPLPAHRWDKIQDLTIQTKLPKNVKFDMVASNTDPANWTVTYDESTNTVTQTATAAYLVKVNLNQDPNNGGTTGGTVDGQWKYEAPRVFFKLLEDDTTYQAVSTTIVNKEYMFVGQGIQIRTDSADPTKANSNSKYQNIDGKAVLPGSINNYVIGWDFDQYKNVNIDSEMQKQGLHLVDDYPEDAVDLTGPISVVDPATGKVLYSAEIPKTGVDVGSTGVFKDANGKDVEGFVWKVIDNDSAPDNLKGKLKGKALMISYTGTDNEFYKKYVEGGHSLNVVMPMTTKKIDNTPDKQGGSYNGNSYSNVAWQSDFGNEYKTNEVTNTVPKLDPNKDAVISFANLESLDINKNPNASIENGTYFQYRLSGSKLPTNLSEDLESYVLSDELPVGADEYNGSFIIQNGTTITFKAGSTLAKRYPNGIPAGSDISKYFTQTVKRNVNGEHMSDVGSAKPDTKVTRVDISADKDFLSQIDYDKTMFNVEAFMTVKRITNTQKVRNVFNETINGVDFGSTEVFTNSRNNAIDDLNDKINSLSSQASSASSAIDSNSSAIDSNTSGIDSNASAIASMNGALSVIIKSIDSVASSASSAVDSLSSQASSQASQHKSDFDYTNSQVSSFAKSADSAINSIASSASSAIASNSGAIGSVASSTSAQASAVAKDMASIIAELNKRTDQSITKLVILDKSVKTDADALVYAVNRGVAAGSIKSITKDSAGRFVVSYNASKTGINNSPKVPIASDTAMKIARKNAAK